MNDNIDALLRRVETRRRLPSAPARRLLREQAGLSQGDVAGVLGVSTPTVSGWERGEHEPRGAAMRERYLALLDRIASAS